MASLMPVVRLQSRRAGFGWLGRVGWARGFQSIAAPAIITRLRPACLAR